jgi:hypothetical protein
MATGQEEAVPLTFPRLLQIFDRSQDHTFHDSSPPLKLLERQELSALHTQNDFSVEEVIFTGVAHMEGLGDMQFKHLSVRKNQIYLKGTDKDGETTGKNFKLNLTHNNPLKLPMLVRNYYYRKTHGRPRGNDSPTDTHPMEIKSKTLRGTPYVLGSALVYPETLRVGAPNQVYFYEILNWKRFKRQQRMLSPRRRSSSPL